MMSDFIKVNGGDLIPLHSIKRIREVTDADREILSKLGDHVDPQRFNTRIEFGDGRSSFASESISDFHAQGIELVKIDKGAFILAENIIKARDLSDEDRKDIENRMGRQLRESLCTQVETKAGMVLASIDAAKVMHRMAHPEFTA